MSSVGVPWVNLVEKGKLNPLSSNGQVFAYDFGLAANDDERSRTKLTAYFHFGVWLSRHSDFDNYCVAANVNEAGVTVVVSELARYVLFGDRTMYIDFKKWMKRYSARYVTKPMREVLLPRLPTTGKQMRLSLIETPFRLSWDMAVMEVVHHPEIFEMWCWVDQNTTGRVYCGSDGVMAFTKPSDAVAFKLRWV